MKNLTKIFMAVVAGMFAFSCVTDTIVDPTVELGNEVGGAGQYTLTLSLGDNNEALRTELGEKVGTEYPVKWCEDDVVSVNGTPSTSIELANEKGTAAVFTFGTAITRPYNVVYPAAVGVEAVAEGCYPVTFLSTQYYTEGTFCDGAAPMCGYATEEEGSAIEMKHLTSVLRFLVKGSNKLTSMTITAENGVISGNYDVNCQTGEVTPHDDARNDITVSFGEGLQLGDEATPVYVTVPTGDGDYGVLLVKLRSAEGVMTVKVSTTAKPLTAGKVREFNTPIVFVPGEDGEYQTVFEIANEADMATFKNMMANYSFYPYTTARVVADITMPADWTPIEGFAYTFDGGNNAIKGLKAPLFGTVDGATIQNVKLTDVAINETERLISGALVCKATNSVISNCSTAGSFTYAYAGESPAEASESENHAIGGLVGLSKDTNIEGCTNSINLVANKFFGSGGNKRYPMMGGVAGIVTASAEPASKEAAYSIKNCTNLGSITSNHNSDSNGGGELGVEMGGVIGHARYVFVNNIVNGQADTENGAVSITAYAKSPYWGGCIGWLIHCYADGMTNYAPVYSNNKVRWSCMGGIVGTLGSGSKDWSIAENLTNYGNVYLGETSTGVGMITIGGIIGRSQSTKWTIKKATNYGNITVNGNQSGVSGDDLYVGGVFAECNVKEASECYNYGSVKVLAEKVTGAIYAGGVAGAVPAKTTSITLTKCETRATGTTRPVVEVTTESTSECQYVGGTFGFVSPGTAATISYCKNFANVKLHAKAATQSLVSGLAGYAKNSAIDYCENDGEIYAEVSYPEAYTTENRFACLVGHGGSFKSFTNNHNRENGDLTIRGAYHSNAAIAALASAVGDTSDCSNAGDINVYASNTGGTFYIMGITWSTGKTHTNFTNTGNFTFYGEVNNKDKYLFMSGVDYNAAAKLDNCVNSGTLKVDASAKFTACKAIQIGGISRTINGTTTFTSCKNSGNIVFAAAASCPVHLGGLVGATENTNTHTITDSFENSGNIEFTGSTTSTARLGGVIGSIAHNRTLEKAHNKGNVIFNSNAATEGYVGGVCGFIENVNGTITNCNNHGNVTASGNATGKSLFVGGILGHTNNSTAEKVATISNCQNYNNEKDIAISVSATCKTLALGGIVGNSQTTIVKEGSTGIDTSKSIDVIQNCTNNCAINYSGTLVDGEIHIGGVLGSGYLATFTGNENGLKGDITTTGTVNKNLGIGGLAGRMMSAGASNCTNKGDIVCNTTNTATTIYLCGIIYGISGSKTWNNLKNEGKVSYGGRVETSGKYVFMSGVTYNPTGTFKNCSNSGDIHFTSAGYSMGFVNMGGIFRCLENTLTVENCSNSGDLIFEGESGDYVQMGGLAAYKSKADKTLTLKGFTNSGDCRIAGKCKGVEMGGILGKVSNKALTLSNTITNSGNFYNYVENEDGTKKYANNSGTVRVGGILGWDNIGGLSGTLVNTGNITFENKISGKTYYIGGVCGQTVGTITGATTSGTITAIGFTNVGAVTGVSRTDAIMAKNCSVAGTIDKGKNGQHYDPTEDATVDGWYSVPETLYTTTFHDYIYSTPVDASVAANDGCTCPTPEPTPAE